MASSPWTTVSMKLKVWGEPVEIELPVPEEPVAPREMLPVFQALTNKFVAIGTRKAALEDRKVSCHKGCAQCCRQLIPVSAAEAHQLRALVENLEPDLRERIRARAAEAQQRIEQAGLMERIVAEDPGSVIELGLEYFDLRIDCPFLEDEACTIHVLRPLACREYLVTSPPEECLNPNSETVVMVRLPAYVSRAVRRLRTQPGDRSRRWIPLVLALDWAESHPEDTEPATGPELLREVLGRLSGGPAAT